CGLDQSPIILTQPQNQTVFVGETANFSMVASGTPPLNYQWQFNGSNIDGATSSSLAVTNAQLNQAGNYSGLVSNSFGFLPSSNATLTVNQPTCTSAPSGLVSWWPGNGDAQDIVGGQSGTFTGYSFGAGEVGQAFSFSGAGNNVRVPASPTLDVGQGPGLSVEAW